MLTPIQQQYLTRNGFVVIPSAQFEGMAEGIARRELAGQWPTGSEAASLIAIGDRLKALLDFPPALMAQITSGADDRMALVADVHTHLEGGQVLEEAVGDPFLICVALQEEQYWGAVFSYYEFKQPIQERLTDEAWQAMSPRPPLPPWTQAFREVDRGDLAGRLP